MASLAAYFRWGYSLVLEAPNSLNLAVVETHTSTGTIVRISGFSGNSSCSVKKITVRRESASLVVLVHLMLAREGTSGSFQYDLAVPNFVEEIGFGKSETVVWKRART